MRYTQLTETQVRAALDAIGADSIDDLFRPVPQRFRLQKPLALPKGLSEPELLADAAALADRNRTCTRRPCFLGGGAYDHFIPALVDALAGQSEFVTAYTPYQAEASQGILQLFYEFQTLVCELFGMEVANASLYEGASAAAEAALMAVQITGRRRLLISRGVHPDVLAVLRTYTSLQDIEVEEVPLEGGVTDGSALEPRLDERTAAVILQSPNFFGCVEPLDRLIPAVRTKKALAVVSFDPLAAGLYKPPGALGADIVVGEGQPLGIPLSYGGPYLGLLATREQYLRKMPGRVVGVTTDTEGRRGFCLVLQTREQHIKRQRATSNICTNQGLLAVRATVYLAAMGRGGIARVASLCADKAHYAARRIAELDGYELCFSAPFFKEFTVRTTRNVERVLQRCREEDLLVGPPLGRFHADMDDCFLVAVTEKRTRQEIDRLVEILADAAK